MKSNAVTITVAGAGTYVTLKLAVDGSPLAGASVSLQSGGAYASCGAVLAPAGVSGVTDAGGEFAFTVTADPPTPVPFSAAPVDPSSVVGALSDQQIQDYWEYIEPVTACAWSPTIWANNISLIVSYYGSDTLAYVFGTAPSGPAYDMYNLTVSWNAPQAFSCQVCVEKNRWGGCIQYATDDYPAGQAMQATGTVDPRSPATWSFAFNSCSSIA